MIEQQQWELWYAYVKYEDEENGKDRPVVIIGQEKAIVLALKVTHHEPRNMWGEYEIIRWKTAGLTRESTVRLSQLLHLEGRDFRKKIGTLELIDILNLQRKLIEYGIQ